MGWGAEPPGPSKEGTNSKYCRTHEAHKLDLYLKVITDLNASITRILSRPATNMHA